METLSCGFNKLTSLDVSNNTKLTTISCYGNRIHGANLDAFINSLPNNNTSNKRLIVDYTMYKITDYSSEGLSTSQVAKAKGKGWTPLYWCIKDDEYYEYEGYEEEPISIDATNFPDKNFRQYLLEQDFGKDGVITPDEISKITELNLNDKEINNLMGIDFFSSLETLFCGSNKITSLDVTKNINLTYLFCDYNQLTSLDVTKNTNLTSLSCQYNQLTSLDVSNNTGLTYLACEDNQLTSLDVSKNIALSILWCGFNKLTSLDVTKNTNLTRFGCASNQLTSLDVTKNTKLEYLSCGSNQLTSLDVSKNTNLKDLYCYINDLTSLDVTKNTNLTSLSGFKNQLTSLDVSKNNNLTFLVCSSNQLSTLDVSKNPNLKELNCSSNQLTDLDVSKNTNLTILYCYYNQIKGSAMDDLVNCLPRVSSNKGKFRVVGSPKYDGNVCTKTQVTAAKAKGWIPYYYNSEWVEYSGSDDTVIDEKSITIDATNFPDKNFRQYLLEQDFGKDGVITPDEISKITELNCYNKEIYDLKGIEFFSSLETLYCGSNKLTSLDVTKNINLQFLFCTDNKLKSLDISNNTNLTYIACWNNQLTSLDVSKNTTLQSLFCFSNPLKSLDVSKNTNLIHLGCYNTQLKELDVSKNTSLDYLSCSTNQLTELNVSNNPNLTEFNCSYNQLTSLDVSKNPNLKELDCSNNQLTSLDVSKNSNLTDLDCSNNQLTSLDVLKNTNLTFLYCYYNQIKGSAMDDLINCLPRVSSNKGKFRVVGSPKYDGNVCTKTQVAAAKAKGWIPYYYYNSEWVEYEGCDPNSIDGIMMDELEGAPIYNLNGQRIDKPRKGINIIGGKKVVIK